MGYSQLLKTKIKESGWSYTEISRRCDRKGVKMNKFRLSRLCNGKLPPADDKTNEVIAEVLSPVVHITSLQLRVAAYKEIIPSDVLESISSERGDPHAETR